MSNLDKKVGAESVKELPLFKRQYKAHLVKIPSFPIAWYNISAGHALPCIKCVSGSFDRDIQDTYQM
jgi:hypothetical protein